MGLATGRLDRIGDFLLTAGGSDEACTSSPARSTRRRPARTGSSATAGLASENEDIRIRVVPAERAIDDALDGRYPNSVTAIALLWLAARREGLRREWVASP